MATTHQAPVTITIDIEADHGQYMGGELINAIDNVASYFLSQTDMDEGHVADIMDLYARHLRGV